jgi:hypothetical protein
MAEFRNSGGKSSGLDGKTQAKIVNSYIIMI